MTEFPVSTRYDMKDHWRCLLSCSVVSLTAMLYGGDVIIIDTLQAMPGFLEVRSDILSRRLHAKDYDVNSWA